MFEPGQEYRTRGGHRVRIYANDAGGEFPVHGAVYIDGEWRSTTWTANGRHCGYALWNPKTGDRLSDMDIHVVKPRIKSDFWVNAFKDRDGSIFFEAYKTKESANFANLPERVACVKFTIDVEEGHGL